MDAGTWSILLAGSQVSANVAFVFVTGVTSGGAYAVTVAGFPAGKTCTVTGGSGTASANVTSVVVACVTTFSIGGSVSGLVGQGLELVLQNFRGSYEGPIPNTVQTLEIDRNGDFVFATHLPSGTYRVGVRLQPHSPAQRCMVRSTDFTIAAANVTDVEVACSEFSYVTNAADNTISAFFVDATTGAIASTGPPVTVGVSPLAIAGTSDKRYVYVANSTSNDVSAFAVDFGTGALTEIPGSPFAAGTNPRAPALYYDSYLYVANSGSGDISVYQIDQSTGVLTPFSPASYATGAGPGAIAFGPSGPSGRFLYTANTGDSNISAFIGYAGPLVPIAGSPFPSGRSVSSLAFGAGGQFLYAADANGGAAAIYGFTIKLPNGDPSAGALTPLAGFPYQLPSCTFVVADQTGTYLYATTGTDILGYSIDALTGALNPLSGFPIAVGANVRSVSIDPANQFLYVANGSTGTVTSFTLNAATGALTPMPGSPFDVGASADFFATF